MTDYKETKMPRSGDIPPRVTLEPSLFIDGAKYPIIFFCPGIGEREYKGLDQLLNAAPVSLEAGAKKYGFVLVEIQPKNNYENKELLNAYGWARGFYGDKVDWQLSFLTGLSLGGGGCQRFLDETPDAHQYFAAAAINCPGPNQYFIDKNGYKNIVNTKVPLWYFHCVDDKVVTPSQSTLLTQQKIKDLNGTAKTIVTLFNKGGHSWPAYNANTPGTNAATPAVATSFNNPGCNIFEWFLMNRIGQPAVMPPAIGDTIPAITVAPILKIVVPPIVIPPLPIPPIAEGPVPDPVVVTDPLVVPPVQKKVLLKGAFISRGNNSVNIEFYWDGETKKDIRGSTPEETLQGVASPGLGKDYFYGLNWINAKGEARYEKVGPYKLVSSPISPNK